MRSIACVVAAMAAVASAALDVNRLVHDDASVDRINAVAKTWTAGHNSRFNGWTLGMAKKLMGTRRDSYAKSVYAKLPKYSGPRASFDAMPTNFDSRQQWANCTVIGHIRDQSACGSCWAFGSAEAFSSRACIASNGASNLELSAQDLTSCCTGFACFGSQGCDGGVPSEAWQYMVSTGIVSGADYGNTTTCLPYELPPCEHHVPAGQYPACPQNEYPTPACNQKCISGYSKSWAADKHHAKTTYGFNTIQDVMTDIVANGPVTADFDVYSDFLSYKSGVYQHTSGDLLGGHAISILGFGVESGTPYWLVANSWNSGWGDHGTFKILRGSDECGIEDDIVAGTA